MVLKVIGACLVMVSSVLAGFYLSFKDTYRIQDLKEMKKGLSILSSEISYVKNPLCQAMEHIGERINKPVGVFFSYMAAYMAEHKGEPVGEMWSESLNRIKKSTHLTEEDIFHFRGIGDTLGYLDENMQQQGIHLVVEYIESEIQIISEIRDKNKKMYQSLGLLAGLLTVIVLI